MAKPIKFKLPCGEYRARTIEDLQEHFLIEDVWKHYQTRHLQRWLEVHGYEKELKEVKQITSEDSIEILADLMHIFNIEPNEDKIGEGLDILQCTFDFFKRYYEVTQLEHMTEWYYPRYKQLVNYILTNSSDVLLIKAVIRKLYNNYLDICLCDFAALFDELYERTPLALFFMLTYRGFRSKMLLDFLYDVMSPNIIDGDKLDLLPDTDEPGVVDEIEVYDTKLRELLGDEKLKALLGDQLKEVSGNTAGHWKPIESSGQKYMVFKMDAETQVRSAGSAEEVFGVDEVSYNFLVLNGIDYRSNTAATKLLYMEV